MLRLPLLTAAVLAASLLAGCDLFGDSPEKIAAAREADGRAIGGACRHAGRAIEDCYALNKKADKAAVFAGWREGRLGCRTPPRGPRQWEQAARRYLVRAHRLAERGARRR